MSIEDQLNSLKEVFNLFDDPKDKFVQLMDMAKESSGLGLEEKTDSNKINIALYHGSISNCKTDVGWTMVNGEDTITIFDDHDFG